MPDISALPKTVARLLVGILFDLDDTLLDHGTLTEEAYSALFRLRRSGLLLMAVTGRPAAWGMVLTRQWPIAAAVTENGAIVVYREGGRCRLLDRCSPEERRERHSALTKFATLLSERYPELESTDENNLRVSDFTFDIGESRQVSPVVIAGASEMARAAGMSVVASSVNLHLSLDRDDKASGSLRALSRLHAIDPTVARGCFAYVGDSDNDAACFAAFETTIAPANLLGRPTLAPRYRTRGERGAGFAEAADVLVTLRG